MRDDFKPSTKEKIAKRVGYRCSNPDCGIPTVGPTSDEDGIHNIGVAAHITAASPRGPRYDPNISPEKRKSHSNGIWLCQTHAKMIDSDESHFTVKKLIKWKYMAEKRAFLDIVSGVPSPVWDKLAKNEEDVGTIFDLLLGYAKSDLSVFQRMHGLSSHTIELNLRLDDGNERKEFTVSGLASGLEVLNQIALIAPPGTGKTTTLLQLADALIANSSFVAIFVPLREWSTSSDTLFNFLIKRTAFRNASERYFHVLAEHGRLMLALDGWNELNQASKRRLRNDLVSLKRDFPETCMVISSRCKDFDIPIDGPFVEVKLLTKEQQMEIAEAIHASDGKSLMEHAWLTPGLREIVTIPLYLNTFLKQSAGQVLPTSKGEVLRSFVTELEQDKDNMATLRETLQGFHREYLEAIAFESMRQEAVALSEIEARAVVCRLQKNLKDRGQISQLIEPMKVLDVLVSAHMLVRSEKAISSFAFQHQQFQEWFASLKVQKLFLSNFKEDEDAKKELREKVLNIRFWEEAILFASEYLSKAGQDGIKAVAKNIFETLDIDPQLSAEMIWRSSNEVWEEISERVVIFAENWHTEGCVDRAVKFMITTGRVEFSKYVWPLISNPDDQIRLSALRAGSRFRLSVLGSDAQERITKLPEVVREDVISEIAQNSDMEGIEFAISLASNDPSIEIRTSIIESLFSRGADFYVRKILEVAPDEVWRFLAQQQCLREFPDPIVAARIRKETAKLIDERIDPHQTLNLILSANIPNPDWGPIVRELVKKIDFSKDFPENGWLLHRAHELYPKDVIGAILALLENGKPVPFQVDEILRMSDVIIDDGPLVDRVLQNSGEKGILMTVVGVVGSKTIDKLMDQLFELHERVQVNGGKYDEALSEEYQRIKNWILSTKVDVFVQAVLKRAKTENLNEISIMLELISGYRGSNQDGSLRLDASTLDNVLVTVQRWGEILLASPEATREQFAEIAQTAEKLKSPALVPVLQKLLAEELTRRKHALEEQAEARKHGRHIHNGAQMSWTLQYRRAFAAIGGEKTAQIMKPYLQGAEFGIDAAYVLKEVWRKSQSLDDKPGVMRSGPDFSMVPGEYAKRQSGVTRETHPFVDDIVAVVDDLIKPGAEDADVSHALNLAAVAFSMPYADKGDMITALLQLPVPGAKKLKLLTILVLYGKVISSEIVIAGIDELLKNAKANPWMLEERENWRFNEWLMLLPFTEKPAVVLEILDRVEDFRSKPCNLRELLSALSYAPSVEAESVLYELAKRDERFLEEYSWWLALTGRETLTAARFLLDLLCNASLTAKRGNIVGFGSKLSSFMITHDQLRKDVYERYLGLEDSTTKSILEWAISEVADIEGVMLMVRKNAAEGFLFQKAIFERALDHVLTERVTIESSGWHEVYGVPVPELRRDLFDMVINGTSSESQIATECLNIIDEIRDHYGDVESEPRHPNIETGIPWPQIVIVKKP